MNSKYKPWTAADDETLLQSVRETPNNLTHAFAEASLKLKRKASTVSSRWYSVLRSDKNTGAIFGIISPLGAVANTKNMRRPKKQTSNFTMDLAHLAVSKLNKAERMKIIDKIMQMK